MASFKFDGKKVTALVDVILDVVISVFRGIYRVVSRSGDAPEPAVEVTSDKKKKRRQITVVVAIFALIGSWVSMFFTECDQTPKPRMEPHLALGQLMAEETSKLLGGGGQVVVVTMYPPQGGSAVEANLNAFKKTLSGQGKVAVTAVETVVQPDAVEMAPMEGVPSSLFFRILEKYPNVSAIVSFAGAPLLSDEEITKMGEKIPKVIVFSSDGAGLKKCFEEKVVQAAIIFRTDATGDTSKKPGTLREWSDKYYQVVTPETASSLPF